MAEPASDPPLPPRNPFIHNAAIAGAVICPLAMLLPPRKADIRAFVLLGTFSLCANQLAYEYTGHSVYERFGSRVGAVFDTSLPQGAQRTQQLLREQRERDREAARRKGEEEEAEAQRRGGVLRDIWMGGEGEDWKRRRAEEHRKSFEEGKGMSDVIFEQVADVFSGRWRKEDKDKKEGEGEGGDAGRDQGRKEEGDAGSRTERK
ncbi:hypothetical protein ESCO_000485 [Escovopsis weberi]|uniref:Rhomboid family membrane protein n=1 Tax=Escovopsis weberi TaxID=150374 RepID=A0A0M8MY31_ESCWE|nr:hypothetical protein ESCO_000485 [Escovopsis weberi]